MKISFLLLWAYGMGGLVRTTVNTANHFAAQGHDVELISFFRHTDDMEFELHPRIRVESLLDTRESTPVGRFEAWQRNRTSLLVPTEEGYHDRVTLRGDYVLARKLRSLDADVLISTRPFLNLAAAMWAPKRTITIGQDHLNYTMHEPGLRWHMRQWYPRLDAMVTLTDADRRDYEKLLKGRTAVRAIGNAVTAGPHPQSQQTEPVVVAAGRYTAQKRFAHLIRAFRTVVDERPDWQLRIFGRGPQHEALDEYIGELGLRDNVTLMGPTNQVEAEFAKASMLAMSSRYEGYPMVILEALGCGLPVVTYNCPRGPKEMITSGTDGLLVPDGRPAALGNALLELIRDPERRREMSRNALTTAERYSMDSVAAKWEELIADLQANRRPRPSMPLVPEAKRAVRSWVTGDRGRIRWK